MTSTPASDLDVPAGTWLRDEHATAPMPAVQAGCWMAALGAGFAASMVRYGLPIAGFEHRLHRGWMYARMVPLTDPDELRRRVETRLALPRRAEAAAAARWLEEDLPAWARRRRLLRGGTASLADHELADRLTDLGRGLGELVEARFTDIVVASLIGRWVAVAGDRLGWDEPSSVAALGGRSSAATSLLRAARDARARGLGVDGLVATHGDLLLGGSVVDPTLAERLDLVAELGHLLDAEAGPEADGHPSFDDAEVATAFADARLVVQWREATHDELGSWLGALRTLALLAGSRLAGAGLLADAGLALHLPVEELADGLRGESAGLGAAAEAQAAAHQRSLEDPPPPFLGPPPGAPSHDGPPLPPEVGDAIAAMAWVGQHLGAPPGPPAATDDGSVRGVGASPGVATGRVRVVLDLADLGAFEPGEVLVCPMTSPGWDLAIAAAAAVVCDAGGLVSHSALLARELGLPAVVGTKLGTAVLRTGQLVEVDGTAGTVTPRP